jgi:hypothetical protein
MAYLNQICIILIPLPTKIFFKRKMKRLWTDDIKRGILKECWVIECNIKNSDKPFRCSRVYWIYLFLHMLNYSCANSYLFNRNPWLLVSHNIASLYLLSNKDVIKSIYIFFSIDAVFLTEATPSEVASVASMEDTPLIVDHIYIIVEVIFLIVDCERGQNVTSLA